MFFENLHGSHGECGFHKYGIVGRVSFDINTIFEELSKREVKSFFISSAKGKNRLFYIVDHEFTHMAAHNMSLNMNNHLKDEHCRDIIQSMMKIAE